MYPLALFVGAGAVLLALGRIFRKKKVFVSYYYDENNQYKNLLKAWDKNDRFDISFVDTSVDVSIRSKNESVIKRAISRKISESDIVLVIIGKKTHQRKWVRWEIEKAAQLGKKIVAVKIRRSYQSPPELLSIGAHWIASFSPEAISEAIA
jgi:hypothetical protein